jgi:hypothetical protein
MKQIFSPIKSLIAIAILATFYNASAQEKNDTLKVQDTKMTFSYVCTSNDSVTLTASLFVKKENGDPYSLMHAKVEFFSVLDGKEHPIGSAITDQDGNALLVVDIKQLPLGKDNMINYLAKFAGARGYTEVSSNISAEPAKLKINFNIEDSVRYLNVTATRKDVKGQEVALSGETVLLYVPRLFSLLKIGEVTLDDQGKASFEFPGDIVGDTLGNLNIIAKIEENEKYGFVQGNSTINWGVPKQYYKAEVPSRELWTPIAPLWMIITLIIMLTGVWAHYAYAVWELVMIKKASKKDQTQF